MNNSEINEAFKKLLDEFDSFKANAASTKASISDSLQNALSGIEAEKNTLATFKDGKNQEVNEIINGINQQRQRLDEYYNSLFGEESSVESRINLLKEEIENYRSKLIEGDEDNDSIKEKISSAHKEILEYKNELFGYSETVDEEIIKHTGIKEEIAGLLTQYEKRIEEFDNQTAELINTKEEEMDGLLQKMEIVYNDVEQEGLSKKFFELSSNKSKAIRNATFLLIAYSILLTAALIFLFSSETIKTLFVDVHIVAGALIRIGITVPLMYLIVFSSSKMKREITIRDHYNYKGSIMTTYRNISTHVKNEEIAIASGKQTELLEKVFNKILENEADKLEKSNNKGLKHLSKATGELAKALGTDRNKLIAAIPSFMEKLQEKEGIDFEQNELELEPEEKA